MQMFLISPRTDSMWVDGESYGVDGEGPVPDTDEHSDNCVVVIPPTVPVTSDILNN